METATGQSQFYKNRMLQLFIVALFAIVTGWLATLLQSRKPVIATAPSEMAYDYRLESVDTSKLDKKGSPIYRLHAEALTHFPEKKYSLLTQPSLIQYLADGKRVETNARQGMLFDNGKTIDMQGNVVMIQKSANGRVEARTDSNSLSLELQ